MSELPILACTLSGSEQKVRAGQWSRVIARATSREMHNGRVVCSFPPDPQLLAELRKLIAAESECCSFMAFEITESPDKVVVGIRLPEEMHYVVAAMFGPSTQASIQGGSS